MLSVCCVQPTVYCEKGESTAASYPELVQVGGRLPVLVIADSRHAGKADGDAVGRVHLGFGELGAGDLPDRRLLQGGENGGSRWSVNLKKTDLQDFITEAGSEKFKIKRFFLSGTIFVPTERCF